MIILNLVVYNKFDFILFYLGEMMLIVLFEFVIKFELVCEVMLGLFKYIVDDGFEV